MLDDAKFSSAANRRNPVSHLQLAENVLNVIAHRGWADAEVGCHLPGTMPLRK